MRRLCVIIVALWAMGLGLVHIRRAQVRARREVQQYRMKQISLRRRLWDQEVRIGQLTTPDRIRFRAAQMPLQLVEKHNAPRQVLTAHNPN